MKSVLMKLSKSTKGTHVYVADNEATDAICTSVYLIRDQLPSPAPAMIKLFVEFSQPTDHE